MKIWLSLFILFSLPFLNPVWAQDKLLLNNGDEMLVKVLELNPDSVYFVTLPDSTGKKIASLPAAAVFSIKYQNGNTMLVQKDAPTGQTVLTERELYLRGEQDAKKYFKADGVFWWTFGSAVGATVLVPVPGPVLAIPVGLVMSLTDVPERKIVSASPALMKERSYLAGYQRKASQKKALNAAGGLAVSLGIYAIALISLN